MTLYCPYCKKLYEECYCGRESILIFWLVVGTILALCSILGWLVLKR